MVVSGFIWPMFVDVDADRDCTIPGPFESRTGGAGIRRDVPHELQVDTIRCLCDVEP